MKALLMHRDRNFDADEAAPANAAELVQDLELGAIFEAMAAGDGFVRDVVSKAFLASLDDADSIRYRQGILADALVHPEVIRDLYAIAVEALERERHVYGGILGRQPERIVNRSVEVLGIFLELLRRVRGLADRHAASFTSEGFGRFFGMIEVELDDAYLATVAAHVHDLSFRGGMLLSARLGPGNKGAGYTLHESPRTKTGILDRLLGERSGLVYTVPDRDVAGFDALAELRNRGVAVAAVALGRSTDHILSFFRMLRLELAFYVGCLNLVDRLRAKGEPICLPAPAHLAGGFATRGLIDASLSLRLQDRAVGNDVDANSRTLAVITGANRGGKSTFLRSVGQAQLMLQCGMFVAAESFTSALAAGVFTHFRREEDVSMTSGKFDEELARVSRIVDRARPTSLVLFNESFASTNEREGSELGRQVVHAMIDARIRVVYVTHLYDLADGLFREERPDALFLRAERGPEGRRTYRVVPGEPLPTSHGADVFRRIFGTDPEATAR
jgi:MutS domain V